MCSTVGWPIAKKDNLTGLFNDRYLHIALSQIIEECEESERDLSLLFIDLDYFKRVNDTYGHLAGSQVLREVGQLLASIGQARDAVAARYGGDEFVIAAPGMHLETAIDLAEEMREAVVTSTFCAQPGDVQPDILNLTGITCSIGVASLQRHATGEANTEQRKSTLLRLSDAAMYVAKETGRNRTIVAGQPVRRRAPQLQRFD
jgi:diguanylate cyclase (GGDEF)-like protein